LSCQCPSSPRIMRICRSSASILPNVHDFPKKSQVRQQIMVPNRQVVSYLFGNRTCYIRVHPYLISPVPFLSRTLCGRIVVMPSGRDLEVII